MALAAALVGDKVSRAVGHGPGPAAPGPRTRWRSPSTPPRAVDRLVQREAACHLSLERAPRRAHLPHGGLAAALTRGVGHEGDRRAAEGRCEATCGADETEVGRYLRASPRVACKGHWPCKVAGGGARAREEFTA